MNVFTLFLTLYAGFVHAFEADHLLAVSNIVSQRTHIKHSLKDGMFWGFGHTSTLVFIGFLILLLKVQIPEHYFHFFEAAVGLMLITLSVLRFRKWFHNRKIIIHNHSHIHEGMQQHKHLHVHIAKKEEHNHSHLPAYGIGLVHGLAGSGALIIAVITQVTEPLNGVAYLLIFGGGSVVGMLCAAGLFSIPFSKKYMKSALFQTLLILLSSFLCFMYGIKVMYENLF
jgi:hypothetical protein